MLEIFIRRQKYLNLYRTLRNRVVLGGLMCAGRSAESVLCLGANDFIKKIANPENVRMKTTT